MGIHKIVKKDGRADNPFSLHDSKELGPAARENFKEDGPPAAGSLKGLPEASWKCGLAARGLFDGLVETLLPRTVWSQFPESHFLSRWIGQIR